MNLRDEIAANIIGDIIDQYLVGEFVSIKIYRELEYGDVSLEIRRANPQKT